jgi:hypothetical protein
LNDIIAGMKSMNEYEKAFVKHIARLNVQGQNFARLTKEAFEAEFGGEGDILLNDFDQDTLENPEKFAVALHKGFGEDALEYYRLIVKFAESGNFHPEEDAELEEEEKELESVVQGIGPDSSTGTGIGFNEHS